MANPREPVVLELAPLPREQVGPFLILGLDKDADPELVEANWAKRLIWARKNQFRIPLEDVNWAREVLRDPDRRARAAAAGLNPDTAALTLRRLAARFEASWQPLDNEKPLGDYSPEAEVPDPRVVRDAVRVPELPREVPAAQRLLEQFRQEEIDPWALLLPDPE